MGREREVGPDLDHLVARRVMDWVDAAYYPGMGYADGYPNAAAKDRGQREPVPSYSTNGCAALQVMRHVQDEHKSGFYLERHGAQDPGPWRASFMWTGWEIGEARARATQGYPPPKRPEEGATMAEAVCRAALAFVAEVKGDA